MTHVLIITKNFSFTIPIIYLNAMYLPAQIIILNNNKYEGIS